MMANHAPSGPEPGPRHVIATRAEDRRASWSRRSGGSRRAQTAQDARAKWPVYSGLSAELTSNELKRESTG